MLVGGVFEVSVLTVAVYAFEVKQAYFETRMKCFGGLREFWR